MLLSKLKQNLHIVLLIAIIMGLTSYMIYWGTQKAGFHRDELNSFMQTIGSGQNRVHRNDAFFNVWHEASELESSLTIAREDAFSYRRVTANGAHPPLYFILFHTAYSFVPETFTIWPGIILNILFYIGTLIVLYGLGKMFISNRYLALLPVLFWGVSSAAINLVVLLRMYAMLTFFCVLFTYTVFNSILVDFRKWKYLIYISLVAFLGMMSHFYFFVFAFIISALICFYMLLRKEIVSIGKFALSMGLALLLYQIFGRTSLERIPASRRGSEAIDNVINSNFRLPNRISSYFKIIKETVFADVDWQIIIAIVLIAILVILLSGRNQGIKASEFLKRKESVLWSVLFFTALMYILAISRIAPYVNNRYGACISPFYSFLFISLVIIAIRQYIASTISIFILAAIPCIYLLFTSAGIPHLYSWYDNVRNTLSSYRNVPVVCINDRSSDHVSSYGLIIEFENQVLFLRTDEVDFNIINEKSYDEGLILFLSKGAPDDILEELMEATGNGSIVLLTDANRHSVFYIY